MKRSSLAGVLCAAAAGMLLLPVLATHSNAAAARLEVTASPIQTWTIVDGLPELPVPDVDLSGCGDLADYDEAIDGTGASDTLTAGNGSQILVGLGGDDILRAGNHEDCILATTPTVTPTPTVTTTVPAATTPKVTPTPTVTTTVPIPTTPTVTPTPTVTTTVPIPAVSTPPTAPVSAAIEAALPTTVPPATVPVTTTATPTAVGSIEVLTLASPLTPA